MRKKKYLKKKKNMHYLRKKSENMLNTFILYFKPAYIHHEMDWFHVILN